jgi:hypothetical protein
LRGARYAAAMRTIPILALALTLAACGDDARQAGGVTRSEADALDDAAEMVEQQRLPSDAIKPATAAPTTAPAASPAAAPATPTKPGG